MGSFFKEAHKKQIKILFFIFKPKKRCNFYFLSFLVDFLFVHSIWGVNEKKLMQQVSYLVLLALFLVGAPLIAYQGDFDQKQKEAETEVLHTQKEDLRAFMRDEIFGVWRPVNEFSGAYELSWYELKSKVPANTLKVITASLKLVKINN